MIRQTGNAGDKIIRQATRQAIPRKVLLTRGGDAVESVRPKPRGKLRFLHVGWTRPSTRPSFDLVVVRSRREAGRWSARQVVSGMAAVWGGGRVLLMFPRVRLSCCDGLTVSFSGKIAHKTN